VSPDWPLETPRLTLRPFVEEDFEALHAMRADAEVARYLYEEPFSPAQTRDLLARKLAGTSWEKEGDWLSAAVVERESGVMVGDVGMCWLSERDRTGEIGFIFDPGQQGKGFATESARALVDWAFGTALHRVIGRTEVRNTASRRVLEKLGMRLEARFVENEWVKNEWQSELVYAILEREWASVASTALRSRASTSSALPPAVSSTMLVL
jgi:RimJ/RimL family protein N-acetyltransferase